MPYHPSRSAKMAPTAMRQATTAHCRKSLFSFIGTLPFKVLLPTYRNPRSSASGIDRRGVFGVSSGQGGNVGFIVFCIGLVLEIVLATVYCVTVGTLAM